MKVNRLLLSGYRNLKQTDFEPCENVNIIFGNNAQGKTNLIEALWLFTGSRSFRGSKDIELKNKNENSANLKLNFTARENTNNAQLEIIFNRKAILNNSNLESATKLAGEFCAVIFSPEHLSLVKDSPQLRRKFIDAAICQLWPRHVALVLEFSRIIAHRNALLKDIKHHSGLLDTLDIWDNKLSSISSQIIFSRLRYIKRLAKKADLVYNGISNGKEQLTLIYHNSEQLQYSVNLDDKPNALKELYSLLSKDIKQSRQKDLARGTTHIGPHRDDLLININGTSARQFGSQGQQRSAVLALKLAEAEVLKEQTGEPPILLLDDVMSELDKGRQAYILNCIEGWQVFITCCDPSGFSQLKNGTVFEVIDGTITKIENPKL
jgi:DNA replication and repair protein RecF